MFWLANAPGKNRAFSTDTIDSHLTLIAAGLVIEDEGQFWIAKFNRIDDPWNHARVEHAMLVLAGECGLTSAECRITEVAGRDLLLVKRFDREP